jgi:hypothetical protein
MLAGLAPDMVAYDMSQIMGYQGIEAILQINLDAAARIYENPRCQWSRAELEIIDQKCLKLIKHGIVRKVVESNYACNPVLAMKRAPDDTWSDKRCRVNFILINNYTELDVVRQ